jgi:protein-S-isoprenylcysteine O-methyltransferase Ste14
MTKILPPTYFFAAIALTIALHFLFPVATFIPLPWRFAGLLLIAAGIPLNIAADRQFKRRNTTAKPFEKSSALVTDGVCRWSRNPMYLGMVLIVSGIAVIERSVTPWIVVAALAVLLERIFILREENMLQEAFGTVFQEYRMRTRRWL